MYYQWLKPVLLAGWDDEVVVYQELTGDTHCFTGFAKDVVVFGLTVDRFSLEDLSRTFSDYVDTEVSISENIEFVLNELLQKKIIFIENA